MELIITAFAVFLNFGLLKWKLDAERYSDLFIDLVVLGSLTYMFGGTMGGIVIGLVAGAMMSVYLLFFPPKFMANLS